MDWKCGKCISLRCQNIEISFKSFKCLFSLRLDLKPCLGVCIVETKLSKTWLWIYETIQWQLAWTAAGRRKDFKTQSRCHSEQWDLVGKTLPLIHLQSKRRRRRKQFIDKLCYYSITLHSIFEMNRCELSHISFSISMLLIVYNTNI